jgi:GrpB-like predicted nucleotidyltransferase (UPF0157 family)
MNDDLNDLTSEELGILFPIAIVDYDPGWGKIFLLEKQNFLRITQPGAILRIEHIGSTAIPGLCAKPTIDILLEISGTADCDLLVGNLRKIHYQHIPKPENPPPHLMLVKGYSKKGFNGQSFHIHVRYQGDWDEIVFRDYLISNPSVARSYGELKRSLAIMFKNDREKYTDSKSDFISGIVKKAREEHEKAF